MIHFIYHFIIEKEALAVVWGCERFSLYLLGPESFQLVTDFKALEFIYGPKSKPSARVERWVLCLMAFKYTVRHDYLQVRTLLTVYNS